MALKALLLKRDIDNKRSTLKKLEEKTAEFEKREAELKAAIGELPEDAADEQRSALNAEVDKYEAERAEHDQSVETLRSEIENLEKELEKAEEQNAVPDDNSEERNEGTNTMITRDSAEYVRAFAEYVKGEKKAEELRALLTENASGEVAVPTFVYETIKNTWEKDDITRLAKKLAIRGNFKVGFEISGDDAVVHTEGGAAISEEDLVLGIVTIVPQNVMKAVQVSVEALAMGPREFLEYLYGELTYRIAKKVAGILLGKICACGTASTSTCVSVPVVTATTISVATVAKAMAKLSDQASDPVVVINKASWGDFKDAQYANKFNVDPFEGLKVLFSSELKSFEAATTGDDYMIVGDFGNGALITHPENGDIDVTIDRITLKKRGLVELFGNELVGVGIVAPDSFVRVQK